MDSAFCLTILLLFLVPFYFLSLTRKRPRRLPPGSLGLPFIGQSLSFFHVMRANTAEQWLQQRIRKYGPVSKLNIFGKPTVLLHGQPANKFIYTCDGNILANQQPASIRILSGARNILELSGDDHKRVRGAIVSFLKPEILKQYVGKMDEEIRNHLKMHWHGKQQIEAGPLMKTLTFNVMSSLIFGIEHGARRDELVQLFQQMVEGILTIPLDLPFTRFRRGLKASARISNMIMDIIHEKRTALEQNLVSPHQDLITCLLSIRGDDNSPALSDNEIVDNIKIVMLAGYDTTSILISFLIRLLANNPSIYSSILQEQEDIAKSKASGELLTWDDLMKMKFTWRVAMETLRMTPPVFCSFRKVLKEFEYEGYIIPKGWQVIWAACMTHMDDRIFPDPSSFDPLRFEKQAAAPPFSFVAFGGGPRMCPGNEFARIETLVAIHYLVTQFTWKTCSKDTSFSRDPLPVFKEGLPILIEPKHRN